VTAVIISVAYGFYDLYHRYVSGKHDIACDLTDDTECREDARLDLQEFRGFLRNLVMHAAVGTALGGVTTLVGEPQNLLIATVMDWDFVEFFFKVAPVSLPVLAVGIVTCLAVEKLHLFGYGRVMPETVRQVLQKQAETEARQRSPRVKAGLVIQALGGAFLILVLGFHLAEVGLVGLTLLVLLTAFNGVTEEHRIGRAFEEALPFTSLLVVFFCIVAVIHDQHLFRPVTQYVLGLSGQSQLAAYYLANGFLSMISDNVFVATVYISEASEAFRSGLISREQFDLLAVAINTGTNIPSVATPNGQAAFLFLLTSALAPVIRLSYGRMVLLALPYTVTMTLTGLAALWWFL
jgi:NhaB family Na+:H+ antiporter